MKKTIVVLVVITVCIGMLACTAPTYELPHDQFCFFGATDQIQEVPLRAEDKAYIIELLNEAIWTNDLSNCEGDFVFYTQQQEVRYHSKCGTFTDMTNQKAMTVSDEARDRINAFW